jgi:hypothetical protein
VKPAIAERFIEIVQHETLPSFILTLKYSNCRGCFSNSKRSCTRVSSAIMTNNLREAELFLSVVGSDCGIANKHRNFWSRNRWCFWWRKETVADESDLMLGKYTCDVKLIQSTTLLVCHWHKGLSLIYK